MSEWVWETIKQFGAGMGLNDLGPSDNGLICLEVEGIGTLFLEEARDDTMLVYIARDHGQLQIAQLEKALRLCHYQMHRTDTGEIHCGIGPGDELVFVKKIPKEDFIISTLEKTVDELIRAHELVEDNIP